MTECCLAGTEPWVQPNSEKKESERELAEPLLKVTYEDEDLLKALRAVRAFVSALLCRCSLTTHPERGSERGDP